MLSKSDTIVNGIVNPRRQAPEHLLARPQYQFHMPASAMPSLDLQQQGPLSPPMSSFEGQITPELRSYINAHAYLRNCASVTASSSHDSLRSMTSQ